MTAVAQKAHATLGASNSHRWMHCPGSVQFTAGMPPAPESIHAKEGTRAHALAELCLRGGQDPQNWLGIKVEGGPVTQEMIDAVRLYLQLCRGLCMVADVYNVEQKFDLAELKPPVQMFGTADFTAFDAKRGILYVTDLKYGQGVVVEAVGNPQLQYYALGTYYALKPANRKLVKSVVMTIVQPRAAHPDGPVRSWEISIEDLHKFGETLIDAAHLTQDPHAPLIAGKQCRWCPAAGVCPAQREHALQVAQTEFSVVDPQPFTPPKPETIPPAEFAAMLAQLHVLEDWAVAMRQTAQAKLERGEEVPGFKLVEKRAVRKWADVKAAETVLRTKLYDDEDIFGEPTLKSVAQIEKLVGKKDFAASPLAALVKKESSGLRLAPDSDPAPAVSLTAGSEFALLPAGQLEYNPEEE